MADRTGRAGSQPADKRDECGCHRECTVLPHECAKPCRWPACLTEDEAAAVAADVMRDDGNLPLPENAIQAAARVLAHHNDPEPEPWPEPDVEDLSTAASMLTAAAPVLRAQGAAAERDRCVTLVRAEATEIRADTAPLAQTIAIVLDDVADLLAGDAS